MSLATSVQAELTPTIVSAPGSTSEESRGVRMKGVEYNSWTAYFESDEFRDGGRRCGKPASVPDPSRAVDPSDCTYTSTNPTSDYDTVDRYEIQVVVHIIEHTNGSGAISDAMVDSQIEVLNEDFEALAGTPGSPGYDTGLTFVLATEDPGGSPTTGITRSVNSTWFTDGGSYWNTLAWDTSRYMNIYTNNADGNLGYVPDLPQGGIAGNDSDRVVILWSAFGRNSAGGPPYDQGRTLTHEVGHYLGLEHTFSNGCGTSSSPGCYTSGDYVCDTNAESTSTGGCPGSKTSCGSADPIENYMDYSNDTCMDRFTNEQSHRMRCSLLNYRADLYQPAVPPVCGDNIRSGDEDCDGTDATNCEGLCTGSCTCPAAVCGNDVTESGEECDGLAVTACPTGTCELSCVCPAPSCGNAVTEAGEDCDGADDSSCPGECDGSCDCPTTCSVSDLEILFKSFKSDDRRFKVKGNLHNSGTYDGMDPRNAFSMTVTQLAGLVTVTTPALDAGWEKSKPEKGIFKWKGDLNGLRRVKIRDKTAKKGYFQVQVNGREVPGAATIDYFNPATISVNLIVDAFCADAQF